MTMSFSLSGLEDVAAGEESPRRDAILSALTNQYLELEPRLSDRHIELYDNVFRVLVQGIELQARLALAEKLATVKRAPREIIRDLANDEYVIVAGPVLQKSPVLDENDLIAVARNRSEAHRAALAQRPELNTQITDALVDRREQSVLVALIGNDTARLSADGAGALTEIASSNMVVAQALAVRLQLPATAVMQILLAAKSAVIDTLAGSAPQASAGDITAAVGRAVGIMGSLPAADQGGLNRDHIVTLFDMGALGEVCSGIAELAMVDRDLVKRALEADNTDGMLIVLKAAGFERHQAEGMLSVKLGLPVGSRALNDPLGQFDRINAVDPARMLGFVLSRGQQPLH